MDIDTLARVTAPESKAEPPKSPPTPSRRFRWFSWTSSPVVGEPLLQDEDLSALDAPKDGLSKDEDSNPTDDIKEEVPKEAPKDETSATPQLKDPNKGAESNPKDEDISIADPKEDISQEISEKVQNEAISEQDSAGVKAEVMAEAQSDPKSENSQPQPGQAVDISLLFSELDPESLSLRPTSEELNSLDLKPGANTIRFFVESSSVELNCRIFLWSCHTKIVISDVDGTITRSDVLGHLLPAVGRDWSHVGVAGLYTQIEKNGYKILYLTARPIGQASQTRAFLHSVTQGSARLPNGPVLMSPNRLVESFTREVIHRKPHEFKIGALREVRSLFPLDYNPFHAGFGNRETDVISYRAVGLIPQRIFVVNPSGELVVMKAKYESAASYSTLRDLVESVFPDISGQDGLEKIKAMTESATFNDWNYWKGSLPEIDLDGLLGTN